MVEFTKVTRDALVALPWKMVVRCVDLNLEMGGIMRIEVSHDAGLTAENMVFESDYSELTKRIKNAKVLESVRGKPFKAVYSSPRSQRILELPFNSRVDGRTMIWHLARSSSELLASVADISVRILIEEPEPSALVSEILKSLPMLECWGQLNSNGIDTFVISVDRDLAEALPDLQIELFGNSRKSVTLYAGKVR